ncbi:MAG: MerR family transcriptional regulator [Acetatifactor sp.]|nr:MerR family transcriptional regulator [Acetatifactor sp.]
MTIKEVEERTGLARSNIRFYEKEKLIEPLRNDKNGYRDYSETDIETIKKIAYLRTLEISIEDIRHIISGKVSLIEAIEKQATTIKEQLEGLNKAKIMCDRMLEAGNISFEELQVEQYVTDLPTYWNDNETVFTLDSVSFLYMWGSFITWAVITALCLIVGILSYTKLPSEMPVQWSDGIASSLVDKKFIFAYPVGCIAIRYLLRPFIYAKLQMNSHYGEIITEYLSNYACFIALSVELFSILFVQGLLKNVVAVLLIDTAVLIGILIAGIAKMGFWSFYAKEREADHIS